MVGGQVPNNKYIIIDNNNLVQIGANWYTLVHFSATWRRLVKLGADSCGLVPVGVVGVVCCPVL